MAGRHPSKVHSEGSIPFSDSKETKGRWYEWQYTFQS